MKHSAIHKNAVRVTALIAGLTLATSAKALTPVSDLPDFDNLPNFGLLGNNLSSDTSSVNGNVGVANFGSLTGPGPFTVNGDLYEGDGATTTVPKTVTGTTFTGQDLTTEQNTVFSASEGLSALTPDETFSTLQTGSFTFTVPAGQVYVVNFDGGLDLSLGNTIKVTGGGGLVLNIGTSFDLSTGATITGPPDNIFINYLGTSTADLSTALINAQIFIPTATANISAGAVNGGVFSGNSNVNLSLGQVINQIPIPEPGTLALVAMGGISMILLRRRLCSLKV